MDPVQGDGLRSLCELGYGNHKTYVLLRFESSPTWWNIIFIFKGDGMRDFDEIDGFENGKPLPDG